MASTAHPIQSALDSMGLLIISSMTGSVIGFTSSLCVISMHCNTLLPQDERGYYKIDPSFKPERKENRAWMRYIFTVPWERLVKVDGEVDGEQAWKTSRRRR